MIRFSVLFSVFLLLLKAHNFYTKLLPDVDDIETTNLLPLNASGKTQCKIELEKDDFPRVCEMNSDQLCQEFNYILLNKKKVIKIADKKTVFVACGRKQNLVFNGVTQDLNAMELTCDKNKFKVKCEVNESGEPVFRESKKTVANCPITDNILRVEIGLSSDRFYSFVDICFDISTKKTLYAMYEVTKGTHVGTKFKIPKFKAKIMNNGNFDIVKLYENQKTIIGALLNNEGYINEEQKLTRGHLAPAGSFIYNYQKEGTFFYVNTDFQWKSINAGNWNRIEQNERNCINEVDAFKTLEVYVGTYGRAKLPRSANDTPIELKMQLNDNKQEPIEPALYVPSVFWKVLYTPGRTQGIAVLTFNNPYEVNEAVALQEITCTTIPYLDQPECLRLESDRQATQDPVAGRTYFCKVDDQLKNIIPVLPAYNVEVLG